MFLPRTNRTKGWTSSSRTVLTRPRPPTSDLSPPLRVRPSRLRPLLTPDVTSRGGSTRDYSLAPLGRPSGPVEGVLERFCSRTSGLSKVVTSTGFSTYQPLQTFSVPDWNLLLPNSETQVRSGTSPGSDSLNLHLTLWGRGHPPLSVRPGDVLSEGSTPPTTVPKTLYFSSSDFLLMSGSVDSVGLSRLLFNRCTLRQTPEPVWDSRPLSLTLSHKPQTRTKNQSVTRVSGHRLLN